MNLLNKDKEQGVVSERPLQIRHLSSSKLAPNTATTGKSVQKKVSQVKTFDNKINNNNMIPVDLSIPSTNKSNVKRGHLLTENSLASDIQMHQQITKVLDLDSDSVSHSELLEHIKRNKVLAEEAAKSRQIVEDLKSNMKKL